jgi:ABC-2 type transport system permease protein
VLWFALYEVRRAVARRKVLALVVFTMLIDTVPYYLLKASGLGLLPATSYPYLWVAGIFIPQGFFLPFIALLIAAGSMSEEYEQGTAEVLLSKPVSRDEFFLGKYAGGFLLLIVVILLNATLTLASATVAFGTQQGLGVLPSVVLSQVFASTVFYSISFMSGELVRRSSLSYVLASAVYFASTITGFYLSFIYVLTGNALYQHIDYYLPTTVIGSLPSLVAQPGLPAGALTILDLMRITSTETSIPFCVVLILAFALGSSLVARAHFRWADIAKRIS